LFKNSIKRPTVRYTPRTGGGGKKNASDACVCVRAHVYNFPLGIACRRLRAHLARETRPLGVSAAALARTAGSAGRITNIIGPTSRVCTGYTVYTAPAYLHMWYTGRFACDPPHIAVFRTRRCFTAAGDEFFFRIADLKNSARINIRYYKVIL